ncbi:YraN family protein [Aromatoleum toluclasticum]|uniref:YraN family protein n=1 Tax=Aromatoleum toluclasticum TaxID=92003 RepID=UPI000369BD2A|nr:YraN family protein [Aromatoleum toluclasticum]MCC4117919.1 YraN family protein [Aromatoleum toluclasticum]
MDTGKSSRREGIVRRPTPPAQGRGKAAEELAGRFLARKGLTVIARNVHCRGGEVDLICLDRGTAVFVEVRLRSNPGFGGAAASITATKRRRIVLAARWWLAGDGRRYAQNPCRFDAVLMSALDESSIEWLRGAFDAGAW